MTPCHICGIPADAGIFDRSHILGVPAVGGEAVLAQFTLHRNYCGELLYFAQYVDPPAVATPGLLWEIRFNGRAREPYQGLDHIVNPWGLCGFPLNIRLDEGALVELAVRNVGGGAFNQVGGRLVGRYWYNTAYGGAPNPL
jgi:hypothetical protein